MKKNVLLIAVFFMVCVYLRAQNGSSFQFINNDSMCVVLPDSNIFYPSAHGFTWEMWIYPDSIPTGDDTIENQNSSQPFLVASDAAPAEDLCMGMGWGNFNENWLTFAIDGQGYGAGRDYNAPHYVLPQTHRWYYVAGVCNYDSGYTRLYVDSILVGTSYFMLNTAGFQPMVRSMPVAFGSTPGQFQYNNSYQGLLDEITVWGYPRTDSSVFADRNTCFTGDEQGLTAYYKADEGTGTFTADKTPDHLNGTLINGADWGENAPKECSTSTDTGYSFQFINNDSMCVVLPDSNIFYPSAHGFTWEMWVYPDSIPTGADTAENQNSSQPFLVASDPASAEDIAIGMGWGNFNENWLNFAVDGQGYGAGRDYNAPHYVLPQTHRWYYVAGVCNYDSGYTRLYVDSILVGTSYFMHNTPGFQPMVRSMHVAFGSTPGQFQYSNSYQGLLDEITVWGYPRTDSSVFVDRNTCFTGEEEGLTAYYQANEGTGTFTADKTSNHLNGTLINGANWGANAPKVCESITGIIGPAQSNTELIQTYRLEGSEYEIKLSQLDNNTQLVLFDITGRILQVDPVTSTSVDINLEAYAKGIYIAVLQNNAGAKIYAHKLTNQ